MLREVSPSNIKRPWCDNYYKVRRNTPKLHFDKKCGKLDII